PGEAFDSAVLQAALPDQPQRARYRRRGAEPRRRARRALGPTPQARTKTGFGRRGRARKVPSVLLLDGRHRADRTAIDLRAAHADEELAVETRIARQPRSRADLPVQFHAASILPTFRDRGGDRVSIIAEADRRAGRFRTAIGPVAGTVERGPETS